MVTEPAKPRSRTTKAATPPRPSVHTTVCAWLDTLDLDDEGRANAAIARALAAKLDEAGQSDSGTIAMAISGIAKELRATLDAIKADANETEAWVRDLFAPVGDSSHA